MIKKLNIRNFKSWANPGEIQFSKITGFFGTNSSGKTSLLQFLLLLKQSAENSDRSTVLFFGDEKSEVSLGSYKDVVFKHDISKKIDFDLNWDLEKILKIDDVSERNKILFEDKNMSLAVGIEQEKGMVEVSNISYIFANYKFQLHQTAKKTYSLSTEKIDKKDTKEFKAVRPQGRGWELPKPTKYYGFPEQIKTYYQNIGFLADFQLEVEKLFSRMYYLGPLRDYPKRQYSWAGSQKQAIGSKGEYVIEALLASRKDIKSQIKISPRKKQSIEEYVAHWLKELELIYDFRVEELAEGSNLYQVKVRKTPESSEVLITDVGFGVSQILPVITLCFYAPEHSILIMEQPEIHLHPKVQAGLADVFIDAIKKRNIQIIIESHSEHLLTRMQRRIAEEDVSNKDIQMYFCESINGQSELKHLDIDSFGNIANWPDNFFGNEMEEKFAIAEAKFKRISDNGIQ